MQRPDLVIVLFLAGFGSECTRDPGHEHPAPVSQSPPPDSVPLGAATSPPPSPGRVFVDTLPVLGDQPAFALWGTDPRARTVGVFLHGLCTHGMGFLQSFQFAAAEVGKFVALQGDIRCGDGPFRAWSGDARAIDRRIDAALRAYLGADPPAAILLIGSSQGVERAIMLARIFPNKYRRLILQSGPSTESPEGLAGVAGAFFFVGQHENQRPTKESAERWRRAGISVDLRVIPGAGHSDFAGQGDPMMRDAFRFLGVD